MSPAFTHMGCYSRAIYESERSVVQHCMTELPITIADAWDLTCYEKQPDSAFVTGGPMCKPFCVWGRKRAQGSEEGKLALLLPVIAALVGARALLMEEVENWLKLFDAGKPWIE